jgi:hypothetical protein
MPTTARSRDIRFPEGFWQESEVPAAIAQDNGRIRVEFSMRWYMRLPSLPLIVAGVLLIVVAAQILHGSLFGDGPTSTFYRVSLCGGKGVRPIMLSSFNKREEATGFAREIGTALKLPAKDYVGTEPDEDA